MEHASENGVHLFVGAEMEAYVKQQLLVTNLSASLGRSQARNHGITNMSGTTGKTGRSLHF